MEALDNPYLLSFMGTVRKSRSVPNAGQFRRFLKREDSKLKEELDEQLRKSEFLTLSADLWTDTTGRRVLYVLVHTPTPFLLTVQMIYRSRRAGDVIANALCKAMERVGPEKVTVLVTDSARVRRSFDSLAPRFPWVLLEGCRTQVMAWAVKELLKTDSLRALVEEAGDLALFLR